ncbi:MULTISPECIES: CHAT domain-containing tetratricopeptide repeat protein [unclassified Microcoleus]|uniref:CHAT domain-containing tetratricopeptide repeat protein n=1 Tax=unclassified Microcoleus TaxID=2642155 RepID=UPI002FD5BC0E
MRSRTVFLLSLFIAALTGLLFHTSQNQRIFTQKQNRQTPSKASSETPTQISNPCAKNTIKDKNHSPIISQIPNSEKADILFEQGKEQRNNYKYDDALITFEEALKLYQKEQNFDKEALTLGTMGTVYHNKACYKKAIDYHEKRLDIATNKITDSKKEEAAAFSSLGDAYYLMGNYPKARYYYEKSLAAAEKDDDDKARAIAQGGLGSVYLSLGNYPESIKLHRKRLKLIDKILEKNQELTKEERKELFKLRGAALGSLGNAHHMQASYKETEMDRQKSYDIAMDYFKKHLETATNKDNEDPPGAAIALGELASAYHSRWKRNGFKKDSGSNQTINCYEVPSKNDSDLGQAIDCYQKRLGIAQKIKDRRLEASTYGGLGGIYYSIGNLKPSKENYIADLKYSQENYDKAIICTTEYLTTSRNIQDRSGIGNALNLLGVSYFQISNIFKKQGKWLEENGQETEAKQKIIKSQENLDTAIPHLKDAISARESLREGLTETEKVFIFDTQQTTYLNLQQVYISNSQNELALEVAERGRARAFVDVLAKQLNTNREDSAILNIQDIKRIAQEQQATLVVYSYIAKENSLIDHSHRLYIWVVKPNQEKVDFKKVNLNDLEAKFDEFRNNLPEGDRPVINILGNSGGPIMIRAYLRSSKKEKDKNSSNKIITQEEVNKVLATYYQILIEPINNNIMSANNEKVIFVPQGSLFQIPFAALYDSKAKKYLIEKHPILTTPSIQALDIIRQRQQNRESNRKTLENKDWLILGVKNAKPDQFCSNSEKLSLTELKGAEKEAEDISVLFDISPTLGVQDKTETAVKQKMLQARMIHLATHGLLNNCEEKGEVPGAIALNASGNDDGWLTASEISQMKLQAELIVLSACDTALGRLTADGVIGLSRSAISAGASSAIVSLWNVDDYSTAFLMTEFYRQLKEQSQSGKLDKAEALRQAMLNTKNYVDKDTKKKIYSEPYQWSAFTLVGEATTQLEKRQQ